MYVKKYNILILSLLISLSSGYNALSQEKTLTINNSNLYPESTMKKDAYNAYLNKDYSRSKLLYEKLYKKFSNNEYYFLKLSDSLFMLKDYPNAYDNYIKIINNSKNNEYVSQSKKRIKEIGEITKKNKNTKVTKQERKNIEMEDNHENNYLCNKNDPTIFKDDWKDTFRRWEKEDMPLKIYIPKIPDSYQVENPEKYKEWFKKSIDRWMGKVPSFITYTFVNNVDSANIYVHWANYFKDNSWGLAQMPHIDPDKNKRISNINLAVRAKLSNGEFFFNEAEFIQIVTHEFGHALGLSHSYDHYGNDDMMYPAYRPRIPGSEPDITTRDINTLKKLYSLDKNTDYNCIYSDSD